MNTHIQKEEVSLVGIDWYDALVEDCKSAIVEGVFNARQELLLCYHSVGMRILQEKNKFDAVGIYGAEIVKRIAESLGKSTRTIYYAVQFAETYPSLEALPLGKNISWTKVVKMLGKKEVFTCKHEELVEIVLRKCQCCSELIEKTKKEVNITTENCEVTE